MREFLRFYDLLSPKTSLYFKGYNRYFSWIGLTLSLTFILIIVSFGIYFFIDFVIGKEIIVNFSKTQQEPNLIVDLSEKLFFYQVKDSHGKLADPRLVETFPILLITNEEDTKMINLTQTPCREENFKASRLTAELKAEEFQCVNNSAQGGNIILKKKSFEITCLDVYVAKCKNSTENGFHCYSSETIDEALKTNSYQLYFYTERISIDNYSKNPISQGLHIDNFHVPFGYESLIKLKYRRVKYESDDGIIVTSKKIYSDFGIESEGVEVISREKKTYIDDPLLILRFSLDTISELYVRSYQKLQTFVSNLGGFVSVVYFIVETLTLLFCKGQILLSIDVFKNESKTLQLKIPTRESLSDSKTIIKGNFFRREGVLVQKGSEMERIKKKFTFWEIFFYQCNGKRRNLIWLKEYEALIKGYLDVGNIIALSRVSEESKNQSISVNQSMSPFWTVMRQIPPARPSISKALKPEPNGIASI